MECIQTINYSNLYELFLEQNKKKTSKFWVDIDENELGEIFASQIEEGLKVYQ